MSSITASLSSQGLGPGQSARLIVVATTPDGKQLVTVGPGKGKVLFSSFNLSGILASVTKRGVVSLPDDPRATLGKTPQVHIEAINHPGVTADVEIQVRYDVPFVADFSGAGGQAGSPGSSGSSGTAGTDGSTDPKNPRPGGDGGDGGNGEDGGDGGDGDDGDAVHVWFTLLAGDHPMLQARVRGTANPEKLFLINPAGGSLTVKADGGAGGAGGEPGQGGSGGSGGDGIPKGNDGRKGQPGRAGRNGAPGAAGTITVSVDPLALPFVEKLMLSNVSGSGKSGPSPRYITEPVPPIW